MWYIDIGIYFAALGMMCKTILVWYLHHLLRQLFKSKANQTSSVSSLESEVTDKIFSKTLKFKSHLAAMESNIFVNFLVWTFLTICRCSSRFVSWLKDDSNLMLKSMGNGSGPVKVCGLAGKAHQCVEEAEKAEVKTNDSKEIEEEMAISRKIKQRKPRKYNMLGRQLKKSPKTSATAWPFPKPQTNDGRFSIFLILLISFDRKIRILGVNRNKILESVMMYCNLFIVYL